ncbi:hypothetical protein Glove_31g23 [Diversispora epigaea]|uniref:CN hydrolase domain-containing protein n=1 Tax=Diversispora epigaea TaxID=1348612 RepID=A0A397JJE8_9GLOM|nr:hypothetical protein Glove_31g23 [Diversispora epigaea]
MFKMIFKKLFVFRPLYLLVFLLSLYGLGASPISILPFFNLPLIFLLVRINSITNNLWLFVSLAIGTGFSYSEQGAPSDSYFANVWVLTIVGAAVALLTLLPMIITKYLIKFIKRNQFFNDKILNSDENNSYTTSQFYLFLFPVLWTITWSMFRRYIPLGSWGDWAYTINNSGYGGDPIMQITSIGGLSAVNIILALMAQITTDYFIYYHMKNKFEVQQLENNNNNSNENHLIDLISEEGEEETPFLQNNQNNQDNQNNNKINKMKIKAEQLSIQNWYLRFGLIILLLVIIIFGSHRLYYLEDSNLENIGKLTVGCVLPPPGSNIEKMMKLTDALATQHNSKIILWAESAVDLRDDDELELLMTRAKKLANKKKFYLGLTYTISEGGSARFKKKNMLTLIGPNNETVFDYQKTHPVPIAEYSTESGPGGNLRVENIEIFNKISKDSISINVSGAICLDMDFPELLTTASEADIVLQPAQTWSSIIGLQHLKMASTRAIENGKNDEID